MCPPDDNVCTREYCSGGSCRSEPVTNGSSCTYDGLSGVCVAGVCGENLCEDIVCDDGDACTEGTCDYMDGTCDFTPVVCDDHEECTEDTCDPMDGCVFTAVEDGTECGGVYGMCEAGSCVAPCDLASDEEYPCPIKGLEDLFCCPGSEYCRADCAVPECDGPEDCDDNNQCTEDRCDYANGTCYFTPAVCNDGNPCTEDTCDPADGCSFTAVEDGTPCGTEGRCFAGECVLICEGPEHCDDGNECTQDLCIDGECEATPVADGTPCGEGAGACQAGSCVGTFACTEQGIRDAIAVGGGPHTFDCDGPEIVLTNAEILIDNDVILDGGRNLTIDANATHRVLYVSNGITAELQGVTVTGGDTSGCAGGISNKGVLTLTNSVVSGNAARCGGGIDNTGVLTLINSTVSGNTARTRSGGGIFNIFGVLTLINSTVSGNTADHFGGGISSDVATRVSLINSTVSGNTAHSGGGIDNRSQWPDRGVLSLANTTVFGNRAVSAEGVAAILQSGEHAVVESRATIIDGDCSVVEGGDTPWVSNGYNIESPGDTCGFDPDGTDQVNVTEGELNLGELADNGGPTETLALGEGSVAIDVIPTDMCEVTEDQRGFPRDSMCDVGAFEVQP
ncbi:MAG: hypothetical protein JRG67_11390 [Deltaproteobacteria bacterium]|nr:hypothetical protein [Deltaproteobacteria bacterium]MBW2211630.1 hypothetical protein [Deltaproteobacteria bacterium]MBW2550880.1 hypothetical protein [Deltaproteobacteria bacterium]MBW2629056.1 hypothetical protein [Deltaproteobacteria bacterium]MBW2686142.1 hypothetical protein [Deltaproteobacteria bacterium]